MCLQPSYPTLAFEFLSRPWCACAWNSSSSWWGKKATDSLMLWTAVHLFSERCCETPPPDSQSSSLGYYEAMTDGCLMPVLNAIFGNCQFHVPRVVMVSCFPGGLQTILQLIYCCHCFVFRCSRSEDWLNHGTVPYHICRWVHLPASVCRPSSHAFACGHLSLFVHIICWIHFWFPQSSVLKSIRVGQCCYYSVMSDIRFIGL